MKRMIKSNKAILAEGEVTAEDRVNESVAQLSADYDYLMDSVDKMVRDGNIAQAEELVTSIREFVSTSIEDATSTIASESE